VPVPARRSSSRVRGIESGHPGLAIGHGLLGSTAGSRVGQSAPGRPRGLSPGLKGGRGRTDRRLSMPLSPITRPCASPVATPPTSGRTHTSASSASRGSSPAHVPMRRGNPPGLILPSVPLPFSFRVRSRCTCAVRCVPRRGPQRVGHGLSSLMGHERPKHLVLLLSGHRIEVRIVGDGQALRQVLDRDGRALSSRSSGGASGLQLRSQAVIEPGGDVRHVRTDHGVCVVHGLERRIAATPRPGSTGHRSGGTFPVCWHRHG
jgi:hypothetical protein